MLKVIIEKAFPAEFLLSALFSGLIMATFHWGTKNGLGLGDVKLSLMCGAILGPYYWFISLFFASLAGLGAALIMKIRLEGRNIGAIPIPFAPFLSGGAFLSFMLMKGGFFAL